MQSLVAAGYVLYSASTELVLTFGHGVVGFTLDTSCSASPKAPAMLAEVGDNERALLRTEANSVLQLV